jgi:hypothetical protein
MSDGAGPERNWRSYLLQAGFAVGGALVIAFVFVPPLSPGTDRATAFVASFVFLPLTIAAAYTDKRP